MELYKSVYEQFILVIKKLCPKYLEQIQNSLVVDEVGYKLGYFKEPMYSFSLKIEKVDYDRIKNYINNLREEAIKDGIFDDEKYSLFDDLSDFMIILTMINDENK